MQRPKSNKRKQIRQLARKATERAQGGSSSSMPASSAARGSLPPEKPPAPEAPSKPFESMTCICGQVIRVQVDEEDEVRCACPNCQRKFEATVVLDPQSGKREIFPMFLDEADGTGQTLIAEPAGTESTVGKESDLVLGSAGVEGESVGLTPPPSSQPAVPKKPELAPTPPEPPEMTFSCFCGKKMLVRKSFYRSRVRCPGCSTRLILNVNYDPIVGVWQVNPSRINEPPTGDTRTMPTA